MHHTLDRLTDRSIDRSIYTLVVVVIYARMNAGNSSYTRRVPDIWKLHRYALEIVNVRSCVYAFPSETIAVRTSYSINLCLTTTDVFRETDKFAYNVPTTAKISD